MLGYLSPLINTSLQQLKSVMEINFESNFLLTQLLLPLLFQSDNPSVVFTSSGVGRKGRAFWTSYSISKFAVEGLMQCLADEYENDMRINLTILAQQEQTCEHKHFLLRIQRL